MMRYSVSIKTTSSLLPCLYVVWDGKHQRFRPSREGLGKRGEDARRFEVRAVTRTIISLVAERNKGDAGTYYQYPIYDRQGGVVRVADQDENSTATYEYKGWGLPSAPTYRVALPTDLATVFRGGPASLSKLRGLGERLARENRRRGCGRQLLRSPRRLSDSRRHCSCMPPKPKSGIAESGCNVYHTLMLRARDSHSVTEAPNSLPCQFCCCFSAS